MRIAFLTLVLSFVAIANVQAKKWCPAYTCSAKPQGYHGRVPIRSAWGYGNDIDEAKTDAVAVCMFSNTIKSCGATYCTEYHGPAYPIFSSCVDQWNTFD